MNQPGGRRSVEPCPHPSDKSAFTQRPGAEVSKGDMILLAMYTTTRWVLTGSGVRGGGSTGGSADVMRLIEGHAWKLTTAQPRVGQRILCTCSALTVTRRLTVL